METIALETTALESTALKNIALATFGTRAAADSFMGWYRTWPVHDGKRNELSEEGRWGKVRWLSAGTDEEHWIQLLFPGTQVIQRTEIYWAQESGGFLKPLRYEFQVWREGGWQRVVPQAGSGEEEHRSVLCFAPVETERVRVYMPAGAGAPSRPAVLGLAEWEVYSPSPRPGRPSTRVVLQPHFESRANPCWFNWTPSPGAVGYRLEYSQDPAFGPGGAVCDTAQNYHMPPSPLASGLWHWRVAPLLPEGQGDWSEPATALVTGEVCFPVALPAASTWRGGHPRLPAAAIDRPRLQAEARGVKANLWEQIERRLSDAPPQPPAEPPGFDEGYWTIERWREIVAAGAAVLDYVSLSSFAYALTDNPAYRNLARTWLLHAAGWDPVGPTGIESVDHAAHDTLVGLAVGYDALYQDLSEEERTRVRWAIAARCRALYRYLNPFENDPNNNHPWFQTTALGIGALAVWEEEPEARFWAEFAIQIYVGRYLCLGGADGEWHEGSDYWTYGLGFVFDFIDTVKQVAGLDLYQHPWLQKTATFKLYVAPPGGPGLSFGDTHNQPPAGEDAAQVFRLASALGDQTAQWYAMRALQEATPERPGLLLRLFLWWDPTLPSMPPSELPLAKLFTEAGWALLHSTLEHQRGIHFALHSGRYYGVGSGHSHADQNSFILYAGGEPLVIDSGCYDYFGSPHFNEWFCKTPAHNTLLVNGHGQAVHTAGAHGRIAAFRTTPGLDYIRGDASNPVVYQGRVERFERHVLFLRQLGLFVLIDEVQTPAPARIDWLLHTLAAPEIRQEDGFTRATVIRPGATLEVYLAADAGFSWRTSAGFPEGLAPTKPHATEYHAAFQTEQPADRTRIMAVLAPVLPGSAPPQVTREGDTITIRTAAGSAVMTHRWGEEPSVAQEV